MTLKREREKNYVSVFSQTTSTINNKAFGKEKWFPQKVQDTLSNETHRSTWNDISATNSTQIPIPLMHVPLLLHPSGIKAILFI